MLSRLGVSLPSGLSQRDEYEEWARELNEDLTGSFVRGAPIQSRENAIWISFGPTDDSTGYRADRENFRELCRLYRLAKQERPPVGTPPRAKWLDDLFQGKRFTWDGFYNHFHFANAAVLLGFDNPIQPLLQGAQVQEASR